MTIVFVQKRTDIIADAVDGGAFLWILSRQRSHRIYRFLITEGINIRPLGLLDGVVKEPGVPAVLDDYFHHDRHHATPVIIVDAYGI